MLHFSLSDVGHNMNLFSIIFILDVIVFYKQRHKESSDKERVSRGLFRTKKNHVFL